MKSPGFHHEICRISWNSPDFMKSTRFHHEICQISWDLVDFMKFGGFHHEICQISWIVDFLPLNPVFFIRSNTDIHERTRSTTECCIFGSFGSFQYRYMLNISPYHEIRLISWNPPDFMHEICQISWSTLNPVRTNTDIHERTRSTTECCIFHQNQSPWHEICWISWNPPDFMVYH